MSRLEKMRIWSYRKHPQKKTDAVLVQNKMKSELMNWHKHWCVSICSGFKYYSDLILIILSVQIPENRLTKQRMASGRCLVPWSSRKPSGNPTTCCCFLLMHSWLSDHCSCFTELRLISLCHDDLSFCLKSKCAECYLLFIPYCLLVFLWWFLPPVPLIFLLSSCRVTVVQEEPLALRQLLWLQDELFVGVSSSLLPTSSTVLMLRPAHDADDTLTVRSARLNWKHWNGSSNSKIFFSL